MRRADHPGLQLDTTAAGYSTLDPLTHALSGVALARAIPNKPLHTAPFILLVLLSMAPDADYLLNGISSIFYLQHHRGVTHSLLMLPLWVWLIWAMIRRWQGKQTLSPVLIGAALLMHILLDLITSFGTMILAPLSDWRAAFDLVYIIDPLFPASFVQRYGGNTRNSAALQWQQLPAISTLNFQKKLPGLAFYRWFARFPVVLQQVGCNSSPAQHFFIA